MKNPETELNKTNFDNIAERGAGNVIKMSSGHLASLLVLTVSGFLIPRILGLENFGRYAAVMAVITIMQAVSSCGLSQVGVRYLSPMWGSGKYENAIKLGSSLLTARLVLSVVAGFVAIFWLSFSANLGLNFQFCLLLGLFCIFQIAFVATNSLFLPLGHVGKVVGFEFLRNILALPVIVLMFINFGFPGIFLGLLTVSVILFLANKTMLLRIIPLRLGVFSRPTLRPFIRYGLFSHIGAFSGIVYAQFTVYAVANFVAQQEAAFLAIAFHLHNIIRRLILAVRRSLMPILAEMEDQDQTERLRDWGGLIMRYSTAFLSMITVVWALNGKYIIHWVLTDSFLPVFPCALLILLSLIFSLCAMICNGLLLTREFAGTAALNSIVYGSAIIIGLFLVIQNGIGTSYHIAWVYVAASLIFCCCAYLRLGFKGKIWLPLRRTLLLILPVTLAWPASIWDVPLFLKLIASVAFLVLYILYAIKLRLLLKHETAEIYHLLGQSFKGI